MSNRKPAAYGLAQMLASDPEMGMRIKAWMDANPHAMDRRKQRKLLRDLEAAEALLCAQAEEVEVAASDVGSGLPEHEVPCDGDEAIDDEIACDAEGDGMFEPMGEFVSGQARTYGAACVIKPMHSHAWVLWCAVMAWCDAASRFAAMAVLGLAVALVLLANFILFVADRNWEAAASHVVAARRGAGPMHGYAWALSVRSLVAWRLIVAVMVFARGPPGGGPCCGCDPADWARRC